ncbi:hypothetical protein [Synechococcus phage S-B68]|nr:hypothetical protein [Synechococcus phage S-B68]
MLTPNERHRLARCKNGYSPFWGFIWDGQQVSEEEYQRRLEALLEQSGEQ